MERIFDYVCKMCGLKADARECDYNYKSDQISIRFHCPVCRDGTVMAPVPPFQDKNEQNE